MKFDRSIPMLGFHTRIDDHEAVPDFIRLIKEGLAPMGINTLIMEFNPGYQYECYPQYSNGTFGKEDAIAVREACEECSIRPVPLFQCLSHQSNFGGLPWPLFQEHPELLENPDIPYDATWPDVYCRHWCASNDDIWQYVFPMMDELIDVFGAQALHVGLDEVFDIGEDCCDRCRGKNKAELLARTVKILHDHCTEKGVDMMMWGDRLLDSRKLGMQMWEADCFGMHEAFDMEELTRDIIICDWHYDRHDHGYPSVEQFVKGGFFTVPSLGADVEQSKHFWGFCLEALYLGRKFKWPGQLGGLLFTHWSPMDQKNAKNILSVLKTGEPEIPCDNAWGGAAVGRVVKAMAKAGLTFRKP